MYNSTIIFHQNIYSFFHFCTYLLIYEHILMLMQNTILKYSECFLCCCCWIYSCEFKIVWKKVWIEFYERERLDASTFILCCHRCKAHNNKPTAKQQMALISGFFKITNKYGIHDFSVYRQSINWSRDSLNLSPIFTEPKLFSGLKCNIK